MDLCIKNVIYLFLSLTLISFLNYDYQAEIIKINFLSNLCFTNSITLALIYFFEKHRLPPIKDKYHNVRLFINISILISIIFCYYSAINNYHRYYGFIVYKSIYITFIIASHICIFEYLKYDLSLISAFTKFLIIIYVPLIFIGIDMLINIK